MDSFTISDIENLTGIKAHTLRIWEKRYSMLTPKRKESNHRFYDNEDLKYILQVVYLYNKGYKISKIAGYEKDEIKRLATLSEKNEEAQQLFINRLLEAAFTFNEDAFEETLSHAMERLGFDQCIINVVYPYFEKVGLLWMNDIAVPAQEHFSSNIIRSKIIAAIDKTKTHILPGSPLTLLFTPVGEYHEISLLFTHYLFKKNNKNTIYFGANASLQELEEMCTIKKIDTLYFHLLTNFTKQHIDDYLLKLCNKFPSHKIIMAGPVTQQVSITKPNCILLSTLQQLMQFLKA